MSADDNELHEATVDALVARLRTTGRYDTIEKHLLFRKDGMTGEADVVATSPKSAHYYEVKCRQHPNNYERAQKQFTKFAACCNVISVKFIYVTPTGVKRVYIK